MTARFAGVQPWFPGPLARWKWLTETVPAERMAALRICVALALLVDLCGTYLPAFTTVFSPDALGGRDLFPARFATGTYFWSVLRWLPDGWGPQLLFAVWFASAVVLLVGWRPFPAELVALACSVSVINISPGLHNGGDRLRNSLLLLVAVGATNAVWGVSSVRRTLGPGPVEVPGWPAKMVYVQLSLLYFFGGWYKFVCPSWQSGYVMYFVGNDLTWTNAPALMSRLPMVVHQLTAWVTLVWELGFPVLVLLKGTRAWTLWIGVFFHVVTFLTLEVGCFAFYSVACYAIFVPWERYARGRPAAPTAG